MTNALEEFLRELDDIQKHTSDIRVKCAIITNHDKNKAILKVGYNDFDYSQFLNELDFEYDAGYGRQNISGTVWFDNGTWLERDEYDGSEFWEYKKLPKLPSDVF